MVGVGGSNPLSRTKQSLRISYCTTVAQLVRALPWHGRGRWFESTQSYQFKKHLKKKHYLLLITRSRGRWFESTQSYQFKKYLKKKHYLLLITRSKGRWFESTQSYQFKKTPQEKALPTLDHPLQGSVVRIHSVVPIQKNTSRKSTTYS
jgi:hypothetical protein